MPNTTMKGTQVALRREVQASGNPLQPSVERTLDTPTKAKAFDDGLLYPLVLHQLCSPRVLQEPEEPVFERRHRGATS